MNTKKNYELGECSEHGRCAIYKDANGKQFHYTEMGKWVEGEEAGICYGPFVVDKPETKTEYEFKPFDESDWEMYCGAEGEPEICYTNARLDNEEYEVLIVLDDNGINLDYAKDNGDWLHDFYFVVEEGGKERARIIFNMLNIQNATVEGLQAVGFVYNNLTELGI